MGVRHGLQRHKFVISNVLLELEISLCILKVIMELFSHENADYTLVIILYKR